MTCPAHNRLSCLECNVVPETHEAMVVRRTSEIAAFMMDQKIVRFELEDATAGYRVSMERHPSAFVIAVPDTEEETIDLDRCACGHSLSTEHTESGCFRACDSALCNTTEVAT